MTRFGIFANTWYKEEFLLGSDCRCCRCLQNKPKAVGMRCFWLDFFVMEKSFVFGLLVQSLLGTQATVLNVLLLFKTSSLKNSC